jgi:hypothetical protein
MLYGGMGIHAGLAWDQDSHFRSSMDQASMQETERPGLACHCAGLAFSLALSLTLAWLLL